MEALKVLKCVQKEALLDSDLDLAHSEDRLTFVEATEKHLHHLMYPALFHCLSLGRRNGCHLHNLKKEY